MRFSLSLLFVTATSLVGSLALPQGSTAGSSPSSATVSFPGLTLSPQAQTACISACSVQVANANVALTRACSSATGKSAAECLCTDSTLLADMQTCFGAKCAELKGRCAATIVDNGASSTFTSGTTNTGGAGSTGTTSTGGAGSTGKPAVSAPNVSFPDVNLPAADQSACIKSCSTTVANANLAHTHACAATGKGAAKCLCTDSALLAGMQTCFAQKCKELQGRCAAAIVDQGSGTSFVAGSTSSSTGGSASNGAAGGSGANSGSAGGQGGGTQATGAGGADKNGGNGSSGGVASSNPAAAYLILASSAVIVSELLL